MVTGDAEQVVRDFWSAMADNDFKAAGDRLHDAYVLEWPQSGERVTGRSNFVAINENYPAAGRWRIVLQYLVAQDRQVVTEVFVSDGVQHATAITFSEVSGGRILRQREYWPDSYDPPLWRKRWVEPLENS